MKYFVTGGSGFVGGALIRALIDRGDRVSALARSDTAAQQVARLGADPVRGDLDDPDALRAGMVDADVVVHAAAKLTGNASEYPEFVRVNVDGTRALLAAAGSRRTVVVSTEQVVMGRSPLVRVDESAPYPATATGPYAETKRRSEQLVLAAGGVAVRPRLIWGRGDTSLLPVLVDAARSGRLRWISGGHQLTSTCHVDNVAAGIIAAAEKGRDGQAYFLTDGEPAVFREFLGAMLTTQGVDPPTGSLPRPLALAAGTALEWTWRLTRRPGNPPLDRMTVALMGDECTVLDDRARTELGYSPVIDRAAGLAAMRG